MLLQADRSDTEVPDRARRVLKLRPLLQTLKQLLLPFFNWPYDIGSLGTSD